jgi:Domain of unknown function (DUF6285)
MHDLPDGAALLGIARRVLLDELLPLLPQERRLDARLVAAAMGIAEREAQAGEAPVKAIEAELAGLYGANPHPDPPPLAGEGEESGPPPLAGDGEESAREGEILLRRFAQDLRAGAFENTRQERAARALMWRLTIAKLRVSNPRFLAANGFE